MTTVIQEDVRFTNTVYFVGATPLGNTFTRAQVLSQQNNARYALPIENWRVHDNPAALLPNTAVSDDLAIDGTAFGTDVSHLQTSDADSTSITQRAVHSFVLPPEYVAGQSVRVAIKAKMGTISDTSATLDVEAFKSNGDGLKSGSDLYSGAAQSINFASNAEYTFDLTSSGLAPGDRIYVRITVAITDGASGVPIIATIGETFFDCDIR